VSRRSQSQRGAVYVEFLVVFIPFFILFLWLVQMSFAYAARIVVQHSASRAARSAIVVLPDDPQFYGGAPVNRIQLGGSGPTPLNVFLAGLGYSDIGNDVGGPRLRAIRAAASAPLLAVAPSEQARNATDQEANLRATIGTSFTPSAFDRAATGATGYNPSAMAVTFPQTPGGTGMRTSFGPADLVTVRVTYLFHCGVPVVSVMGCDSLGQALAKLSPDERAQIGAGPGDGWYMVLRAEASLPNQGRAIP
jgi:hypothetical protein